jgi:hypothetical protein
VRCTALDNCKLTTETPRFDDVALRRKLKSKRGYAGLFSCIFPIQGPQLVRGKTKQQRLALHFLRQKGTLAAMALTNTPIMKLQTGMHALRKRVYTPYRV